MSCDEAAKKILSVINNLTIEDSGYLIDYKPKNTILKCSIIKKLDLE